MSRPKRDAPHVVALAYARDSLFELAIAAEVFGLPRPEIRDPWYTFEVCAAEPGPLRATGGLSILPRRGLTELARADTIVVPGWRDAHERPPERLLAALQKAHARGARIVSICSGFFVLAAAGLLDGKRATTHWRYADVARALHPRVRLTPDVLYTQEGTVFTSAGSAAGLDLALHLVRLDFGAEAANALARRLVIAPHRDGGQAQFIAHAVPAEPGAGLARAMDWAVAHMDRPLSVAQLARAAALSPRTFVRRFRSEVGSTPHAWITRQRVLAAQRRLESAKESIEAVAEAVGFGTAQTLRLHFRRVLRTSPTAYRRQFTTRALGRGTRRGSPLWPTTTRRRTTTTRG